MSISALWINGTMVSQSIIDEQGDLDTLWNTEENNNRDRLLAFLLRFPFILLSFPFFFYSFLLFFYPFIFFFYSFLLFFYPFILFFYPILFDYHKVFYVLIMITNVGLYLPFVMKKDMSAAEIKISKNVKI